MDFIKVVSDAVTPEVVAACIAEYENEHVPRINDLHKLYYDSMIETESYKSGLNKETIDRVTFPMARYITTIKTNHLFGAPVKYTGADDEILLDYKRQSKHRLDKKLKAECGRCGFAYEVVYRDKQGTVKSAMLPTESTLVAFDTSVEQDSVFACTWSRMDDKSPWEVTVWTNDTVTVYEAGVLSGGGWQVKQTPKPHLMGRVPVTMWMNNESGAGDYEPVAPLIHALNEVVTDSRLDVKKNVDGLLVFLNTRLAGATMEEKARVRAAIKELGVLEINDDESAPELKADVKTLSSPLNYAYLDVFVERVWSAIFTLSGVPDPKRTEFFTSLSGVALKMQMFLGLRPFAKDSEDSLDYALKRRLKMYGHAKGYDVDIAEVDIVFTYTEPSNDLEAAQIVTYLAGRNVATYESLSGLLSFVDDPKKEVEAAMAESTTTESEDILNQLSLFEPSTIGNRDTAPVTPETDSHTQVYQPPMG